ncbi:hypothetical protein C8F01DRAFT_173074 [Mycena amicta]|nr:hypothetical protein C8F01DRAFT_173074 [Mycena amicta]
MYYEHHSQRRQHLFRPLDDGKTLAGAKYEVSALSFSVHNNEFSKDTHQIRGCYSHSQPGRPPSRAPRRPHTSPSSPVYNRATLHKRSSQFAERCQGTIPALSCDIRGANARRPSQPSAAYSLRRYRTTSASHGHDWLLGIHPHVSWVDRLVVAEVPPRTTGKRRREADEEEEAPSRKRRRREDEIADDEDEATDRDSEPVSPPTSPPPPSLQIPSIRRRPTNPWDSPAPHLRLRPVPSSFRAPATRVIDPTLGYTPPVLARDPHP